MKEKQHALFTDPANPGAYPVRSAVTPLTGPAKSPAAVRVDRLMDAITRAILLITDGCPDSARAVLSDAMDEPTPSFPENPQ